MTIKKTLYFTLTLALILLVTPIVWLKIGHDGYVYYGPNVPDVYILGGTILGKDRSFWGIDFAYKFQLLVILYFIFTTFLCIKKVTRKKFVLLFTIINSVLLLLFPYWLSVYVGGVINNSDCADLTTYPHIGIMIYIILLFLNMVTIKQALKIAPETSSSK